MKFFFCFLLILSSISNAAIVSINDESTWRSNVGTYSLAGFEGFSGLVTNQYVGVTFGSFNGGTPETRASFPHQGTNTIFTVPGSGGGGGWVADFTNPIKGVAFWSMDAQFSGSTVSLYNASGTLLSSYDLISSGSGHGPSSYGFNGYVSSSYEISKITIAIQSSDAIWFDDFQYTGTFAVPESSSLYFMLFGLLLKFARKKSNR